MRGPSPAPRPRPARAWAGRLALAVAGAALPLALVEAVGRVALPAPQPPPGMVRDADLGWALPPASTFQWARRTVHVNALGLRGAAPDPAASLRVLALGDSSVFGDGVEDAETFPAQLDALLPDVEVQNGGVPGYSCLQSRTALARLRPDYDPDVVLVYSMHSDSWTPEPGSQAHPTPGALSGSGLARALAAVRAAWRRHRHHPATTLEDYGACLRAIAADQRARGGRAVFVLPVTETDFTEPGQPRPAHPPGAPVPILDRFRAEMRAAAAESGSPLVDLSVALPASGLRRHEALLDGVHPTPRGDAVIAQALAPVVRPGG